MRTLPVLAAAAVLFPGCMTLRPWRAADPAQAWPGAPAEASATVASVRVRLRTGDWRSWPEQLEDRVTPVEVTIFNDGPTPLEIRPERFRLERDGGPPLQALHPRDLPLALDPWNGWPDPDLTPLGLPPGALGMVRTAGLYDWPGLTAARPERPVQRHGPDPRPAPLGLIPAGRSADFMIYFDVPGDRLDALAVSVELQGPSAEPLGTVRFPFSR